MIRRRVSKIVLESHEKMRLLQEEDSTTTSNTEEQDAGSDVHSNSIRVFATPPSFRVRDSEPGIRVRDSKPGFRVRSDPPGFRVRNDLPGPPRVFDHLPGYRVRPGGFPATRVHAQQQESPNIQKLQVKNKILQRLLNVDSPDLVNVGTLGLIDSPDLFFPCICR